MFSGEFSASSFPAANLSVYPTQADQDQGIMFEPHEQYEIVNYGSYDSSSGGCGLSSPSISLSAVQLDDAKSSIITQRSVSSHSPMNYPPVTLGLGGSHRLMDLIESCSASRVFSTGDLQLQVHQHGQLLNNNNSNNDAVSSSRIIEGMLSKACRYSPEEKKERIERYKNKRVQRNFNKKIKYACRKTLADSRPRIRGRFARNNNNNDQDDNVVDEEIKPYSEELGDDNWVDLFNAAWYT